MRNFKQNFDLTCSNVAYFSRCANSEVFTFNCKEGLVFNEKISVCDWPANSSREKCRKIAVEADDENEVDE